MSQLLGLSFDGVASPTMRLSGWARQDAAVQPSGWGFAWYPAGDYAAALIKDPIATGETAMTELLRDWDRFRAATFLCHLRGAAKRVAQEDTLPFGRSFGGRDWVFAHTGDFDPIKLAQLELPRVFAPVGHTNSERVFCWLLNQVDQLGARRLADVGWNKLHELLTQLNGFGTANLLISDGEDLVAYRDGQGFGELSAGRRVPPSVGQASWSNRFLQLALEPGEGANRSLVLIATTPLEGLDFVSLTPGTTLVSRRGAVIWSSDPQLVGWVNGNSPPPALAAQDMVSPPQGPSLAPGAPSRALWVRHETIYRYASPVERSTHVFRLEPVHDSRQRLLEYDLEIFPQGNFRRFEDVFGNVVVRVDFEHPYSELRLVSKAKIELAREPDLWAPSRRASIPLVWMPWQRQMMVPYLLPAELPEVQLRELSEFAMSFAERQDYDLDETLRDMNQTIYRDFRYASGSTTLATTPWDVYGSRQGVCQDFANLFICLARLLNIPARYRVGYIYTGGDYQNKQQSDASHAWAELYLPYVGWRGFDPTNGCIANLDHVRVACGRNYQDATPTSGTLLRGGGGESLSVGVRVDAQQLQGMQSTGMQSQGM
ncbi:MAG: class II glutamine amidotransferase [Polyangiaceae bacterium]